MMHLLGMGTCHPTTEIDNAFLENLDVGTTAAWIEAKIGIQKRVTTLPVDYIRETRNADPRAARGVATMTTTDLGVAAAEEACRRSGISPDQIGLILCNTSTPRNFAFPESLEIGRRLGVSSRARTHEVYTACPAFALHLDYLAQFDPDLLPDYVLGVCTSTFTQIVNYNDRTDGAIWGDGAAAYILSPRKEGKLSLLQTTFTADPKRCAAVVIDRCGHFHQDGRAVRDFSVRQTVRLVKAFEQSYEIDWSRDVFIGHQANRTMLEQVVGNRKVPAANHWHNVTFLGNQAAAGAPASLSERWDDITSGQKIVVAVVGAGLSWGSVLFEAA